MSALTAHKPCDAPASAWVQRFIHLIPPQLPVLDLACGHGRHSHLLANAGFQVLAVDRDALALQNAAGEGIETLQLDLEADDFVWPFAAASFGAIVVCNYLHRPLLPYLADSLAVGGVLLYETFAKGNGQFGKPSNPNFLLDTAELFDFARRAGLRTLAFEDGRVEQPKPAMVQRICCVRMLDDGEVNQFVPI